MNLEQLRDMTPTNTGPENVLKALGAPTGQASLQAQIAALETQLEALKKKLPRTADGVEFMVGRMLYWGYWDDDSGNYAFKALETSNTLHDLLFMPTTGTGHSWQIYRKGSESFRGIEVAKCYSTASARANALIQTLERERDQIQQRIDALKAF